MSATDVVVGRATRRIRETRSTPGRWIQVLTHEVRWLPDAIPGSGPDAPPHDGHYEVRMGHEIHVFAYPALAASHIYRRGMDVTLPMGKTIEDALADTAKWGNEGPQQALQAELDECDDMLARFASAPQNKDVQQAMAQILIRKLVVCGDLGLADAQAAAYDVLVARFGHTSDTWIARRVAPVMLIRARQFELSGHPDSELRVYEEIVSLFGEQQDTLIAECVAKALLKQGIELRDSGRSREAVRAFESVVARYGESRERELRAQVLRALVNLAHQCDQDGDREGELRYYEEQIDRYGDSDDAEFVRSVAMAFINRGMTLEQLGRPAEAMADYDSVLARFDHGAQEDVDEVVAVARAKRAILSGQLGGD
jgi:tetratricopeptide (TPR) repeat protein